ncbi:MAG: hypothetical protein ABGX76_04370 [Cobetia sp.]|jgi:hypothetical protein|uniref:hypothetical protein n=1 Tax=Halomonadaceae TaxID=28256 RepID=UPI00189F2A34|nr:hypothetical protein [Halomonas sp. KAO]MBF7051756.1 hypothetical protein [Halomonas sp. KAO]|tara:strand:+ start:2809 stop:3171 length:363 start_codon:yes stop_codon:yes gene_type:complete
MIGDDDWDSFFDPDELGVLVELHVPDQRPVTVGGMWSKPHGRETLRRAYTNGAGLRGEPDEKPLQIATRDLPDAWRETRVVVEGVAYAIGDVISLGRLRTDLLLTPWQERSDTHGSWLRP